MIVVKKFDNYRRRDLIVAFCLLAFLLLLSGCRQKELVYPESSLIDITIRFDWSHSQGGSAKGMTVIFYPENDEGRIWRFELSGDQGGVVSIPLGDYRMLAFNNDTKYISYNGVSNPDTYTASTSATYPDWPDSVLDKFPQLSDYMNYHSPDPLYSGIVDSVEISLCSVRYISESETTSGDIGENVKECGNHVIKCMIYPRTSNYTCIFKNVENIEGVSRCYCVLSGFSISELIASGRLLSDEAAYTFAASVIDNDIKGSTVAFGSAPDKGDKYLYLICVMRDGVVKAYRYDVTDQIKNSIDVRNVIIVIEGLVLPVVNPDSPDDGDTGFDVDVNDWEDVIINIIVK